MIPTPIVDIGFPIGVQALPYWHIGDPVRGVIGTAALADVDLVFTEIPNTRLVSFTVDRGVQAVDSPIIVYDAGTAVITFDDPDGDFDPDNLAGPYVSGGETQVTPMVPVRIRARYGTTTYPIFYGFADTWEIGYVSPTESRVTVRATDAFKIFRDPRGRSVLGAPVGDGEFSSARISRVLDSIGWPSGDRNIDTGDVLMQATTFEGSALDEMLDVTQSELGQFYVDGSGKAVFRSRRWYLENASANTSQGIFGSGAGELPYKDRTLDFGDGRIANEILANAAGGEVQSKSDVASQIRYGVRSFEGTDMVLRKDTDALMWAGLVLYQSKDLEQWVTALTIDPRADEDDLYPQIFGRDLGHRITVRRRRNAQAMTTTFGAYLDLTAYGAADWAAAKTEWEAITGITMSAARRFQGTDYTIGTTLTAMISAGMRILLSLGPPHSPVDSTHRTNIGTMMANLRAAGADVRVSLWPEPFFSGLTATQYRDMIAYYGPTVRQYYPLWAVFSGDDTVEANGYIPAAGEIDGIAADHYHPTSTDSFCNCEAAADARGVPLGMWEFGSAFDFGIDPSPVTGATFADDTAYFNHVQAVFQSRLSAGKPNGDVTFFSSLGATTGTINFLGSSRSQLGGFEGGISTWQTGGNCSIAHSTAQAHSGTGSLAVTATAAATMGIGHCTTGNILTQGLTVAAGQTVSCSFWARPNTTARNVQTAVSWYNSSGVLLSSSFGSTTAEVGGAWTFIQGTFVAPANTARGKFIPQILSPGAIGEVHYVDDPQIGVLPASVDHTAPIQYPWDFRIPLLASMQAALDGTTTERGLISRDCFIRGVSHSYGPGPNRWSTKWALQSATKYTFFTIGDADRGRLGVYGLS